MKRSICLILIVSILLTRSLMAQSITGKVVDTTHRPVSGVVVTLKKDSVLVKAELTDEGGYYNIPVRRPGKYVLSFLTTSLQQKDTAIDFSQSFTLDVLLQPSVTKLQEAVVSAKRPLIERKIDRFVFNVENNINTIGFDGLDLLSRTPMVRVDDNAITLVGKGDVRIMVNEKMIYLYGDALIAYLKTIPAESIARIEVITNPSARYDAEGDGGIINIVTKRTKKMGFSGTANSGFTQGTYPTGTGSIVLNYNSSKIRWVADGSFSDGAHSNLTNDDYYYSTQTWYKEIAGKELSRFIRGSVGMEAPLSARTMLGLSYNGSTSSPKSTSTNTTSIVDLKGAIDSTLVATFTGDREFTTNAVNAHLGHDFDSLGKKLSLDLDWYQAYSHSPNASQNTNYDANGQPIPGSYLAQLSTDDQHSHVYAVNAVVDWPGKKINYSFGSKVTFINNASNRALYQGTSYQPSLAEPYDDFTFRENTQAAFVNANTRLGKWQLQAGLRGEATQTNAFSPSLDSTYINSYFSPFPAFFISRKFGSKNVITASWGRRINRPGFHQFDPYPTYSDRYDYSVGNPRLRPSYPNNFELSETLNNMLILSFSYSYSLNKVSGLVLAENGSNVHVSTVGNTLTTYDYVLSTSFSYTTLRWLESLTEADIYYEKGVSTDPSTPPLVSGWGSDITSSNTVYLNSSKTLSAGVFASFQFPDVSNRVNGQAYHFFDIFGRYSMLNNRLQIGVFLRDVFKTKFPAGTFVVNSVKEYFRINNDSRRGGFTIKYSFGNSKMRRGQVHTGLGSESGRAN